MITKEINTVKKCCLYASDFHLEMILLPYIKEKIHKSNFIIITQNDLSDTIKLLLDRVNIETIDKKNILNLDWKAFNIENINHINNLIKNNDNFDIIINGEHSFILEINEKLNLLNNNIAIIDCFNINDKNLNIKNIKNNYKEFLNTNKI